MKNYWAKLDFVASQTKDSTFSVIICSGAPNAGWSVLQKEVNPWFPHVSIEKQDDCRNLILLRACQGLVSCHSDLANAMMPLMWRWNLFSCLCLWGQSGRQGCNSSNGLRTKVVGRPTCMISGDVRLCMFGCWEVILWQVVIKSQHVCTSELVFEATYIRSTIAVTSSSAGWWS